MDECRHNALRIELEILRVVLLGLEQIDPARLPGEAFLNEGDAHFLAANRVAEVIEDEIAHGALSLACSASAAKSSLLRDLLAPQPLRRDIGDLADCLELEPD